MAYLKKLKPFKSFVFFFFFVLDDFNGLFPQTNPEVLSSSFLRCLLRMCHLGRLAAESSRPGGSVFSVSENTLPEFQVNNNNNNTLIVDAGSVESKQDR